MNRFLPIIFVLFSYINGYSQRFKEVVLWQIETRAQGVVFGISEKVDDAKLIIEDFQKRNSGSKYDVSNSKPTFKYTTFPVKSRSENPIDKFNYLAGRNYKVLSKEDIKSLEIVKRKDLETAIKYYMSARNTDWKFTSRRINDLVTNFSKYRIETTENNVVHSK